MFGDDIPPDGLDDVDMTPKPPISAFSEAPFSVPDASDRQKHHKVVRRSTSSQPSKGGALIPFTPPPSIEKSPPPPPPRPRGIPEHKIPDIFNPRFSDRPQRFHRTKRLEKHNIARFAQASAIIKRLQRNGSDSEEETGDDDDDGQPQESTGFIVGRKALKKLQQKKLEWKSADGKNYQVALPGAGGAGAVSLRLKDRKPPSRAHGRKQQNLLDFGDADETRRKEQERLQKLVAHRRELDAARVQKRRSRKARLNDWLSKNSGAKSEQEKYLKEKAVAAELEKQIARLGPAGAAKKELVAPKKGSKSKKVKKPVKKGTAKNVKSSSSPPKRKLTTNIK